MYNKSPFKITLYIFSVLAVISISLPTLNLIFTQLLSYRSLCNFISTILNTEVWNVIALTYLAALTSTTISILLGIPLAYSLERYNFPVKKFIESFADLPTVIPHTVAGIALLSILGNSGLIGKFSPVKFVDSFSGIVAAMFFVSFPIFLNSVREGIAKVDKRLEDVARTLGANDFKAFTTITLPLSMRSIIAGAIVAWARAVSEFGAIVILAYYPLVASTLIYDKYLSEGLNSAEPIAVLLIILTLIIFGVIRIVFWRECNSKG